MPTFSDTGYGKCLFFRKTPLYTGLVAGKRLSVSVAAPARSDDSAAHCETQQ